MLLETVFSRQERPEQAAAVTVTSVFEKSKEHRAERDFRQSCKDSL